MLARRLGVPPGEALQHLIWLARDLDMELAEAAALVVKDVGAGTAEAVAAARRARGRRCRGRAGPWCPRPRTCCGG
ncbi:hypothetical protein BJF79_28595 [Actinomadura sp. CNU-125]|uniref:hypothetical protein n=1 Tax=Actinomadura sp. CNU-125 TaxID=1904961 RepID=UPI00095F88EB|nr:hypothetical protein [Actinomadura sp. CNU-125]OLT37901.1 hypothetical protein BJF79_28595 [Actinomadura sp. CNU-125]